MRAGLLRNLGGGAALFGLRRIGPERLTDGFDQLAALLLLNLLLWAGLDTLHADSGSQLKLDGLYGWAFYVLAGLFACALVARAQSQEADTRAVLIPTLAVSPFALIAFWMLSDLAVVSAHRVLAFAAAVTYLLLLGVRILQAAYPHVRARAVITAAVFLVGMTWAWQALDLDTRLWLTDDVDAAQADDGAEAESLLYDQPARIVAAIEHTTPRESGKTAVFYLGFAGDGEQGIFKREALFAQQVLGEHFAAAERSVELINDNDDRDSYPIATVSGLQHAVKLIASRMDTQQDVLVLLLTSHGSQDGLAVINGSVPLLQLSPSQLGHALDESGIKWRVVIVSACYSGVFLDPLKTPGTLVISAADATHSSFGCDDDRDLTYFGEALLRDSVPSTPSLEEAFRKAAALIDKRETAEHKVHSNPQIFVGKRMHDKLNEIERAAQSSAHDTIVADR